MPRTTARLTFSEKFGYGLGDTASNFFFQTFNIFLLYYYTDVFGISAAAVGTLFFVSKFWDSVNDPIMGLIADRTRTRWGNFRPYLLWASIPYGVLGFLMFTDPGLSEDSKLIYAWATYTLMMMAYTAINVPYSALMGVMSPSTEERASLSTYRFVCAFGGGLLISMGVRPLIRLFGAEDEAFGFSVTMALFAVVSILLFWLTFFMTRERIVTPPKQRGEIMRDLSDLVSNKPWLVVFLAAIFTLANVAIKNAVTVHYFKYYVGDDSEPFFLFFDRTSLFMTCGMLALIGGVFCTKFLTDRFDKRTLMIALTVLNAGAMILFFFIPPDAYWTMMAVNVVGTFIVGPTPALVWAIYADVADYGHWKYGRRATGLVFSGALFAQKFGLTIGGGLSGWLLEFFGFQPNVEQNDSAMLGIRLMFTCIPAGFALANAITMVFYPLRDPIVKTREVELAEREARSAN